MLYRKILAIHLCTGMLSFAFLAMYGASSLQMTHVKWFPLRDRVSEGHLWLTPGVGDARAVARELMQRYGLRGELAAVNASAGGLRFRIARPGTWYQVEYSAPAGAARMTTHENGFRGVLNRIHQSRGLWHEYTILNVWSSVLAVISLALILLGGTGVYLWFRNHRERRLGGALLAAGSGLAAVLAWWMRAG